MVKTKRCKQVLPEDVLIDILLRLPVKSLLRFKCVSKSWCKLIKSSSFIRLHLLKQQTSSGDIFIVVLRHRLEQEQNARLLPFYDDRIFLNCNAQWREWLKEQPKKHMLSFHDPDSPDLHELWPSMLVPKGSNPDQLDRHNRILGPCNGLILVVDHGGVFICNPSMREIKLLPHCPFSDPLGYYGGFDESSEKTIVSGWGFGSTDTNSFKVVQLEYAHIGGRYPIKGHLYNSITNSWSQIGEVGNGETRRDGCCTQGQLFFKGAFHWHTFLIHYNIDTEQKLLTFDTSTEVFGDLEYPEFPDEMLGNVQSLMVHHNCIAMICNNLRWTASQHHHYEVWVMKEYAVKESWTRLYVIEPRIVNNSLSFWKNDESMLFESNDGKLASWSPRTNEINRYQIHGLTDSLCALICKESLISVNETIK